MRSLSENDYRNLIADALVIERDLHGDKVLHLTDGNYLKLFRRKRLISSAAWYPYAQRFADNAKALLSRNIPCPEVVDVFRIASIRRDAVLYRPLPGNTLRELVRNRTATTAIRRQLGDFIHMLHESGIYFRSLHLGNIVLTSDGRLGLIDIADLIAKPKPISLHYRQRNMRHLYRDPADRLWLESEGNSQQDNQSQGSSFA